MLERNRLQAGDFVEPLPIGLPVTLQYDCEGKLEKSKIGYFEDDFDTMYNNLLYEYLVSNHTVPIHILSNSSTIFVSGVLYSGRQYEACGSLPFGLVEQVIDDLKSGDTYNFFAGYVYSGSSNFTGSAQMRTWLQSSKFNLLPGFIVPHAESDKSIQTLIANTNFDYNTIWGYFVFANNSKFIVEYTHIQLDHVNNDEVYLDSSGYIHCQLDLKYNGNRTISFYDRQIFGLYSGCDIVLDDNFEIISKYPELTESTVLTYSCPMCGKLYKVEDEFSRCPDSHCISRIYPDTEHFFKTLNLPIWSFDEYIEFAQTKYTKFSDIFLDPYYCDLEIIVPTSTLLDAIIPIWAVRDRSCIWKLYSACNGSLDSLSYYLNNPDMISSDLKIDNIQLITWLKDNQNVEAIFDIMNYSNITLTEEGALFEGAPIFRNKHMYITGTFKHGSYTEIAAILRSYGAKLTTIASEADCGIIGDIPENVDGQKINQIKNLNRKVFTESEFFAQYDIDNDLLSGPCI